MRRRGVVLVLAGLAVLALLLREASAPRRYPAQAVESRPVALPRADTDGGLERSVSTAGRDSLQRGVEEAARAEGGSKDALPDRLATLVGRYVDERGSPLGGVETRLIGILDAGMARPGEPPGPWTNRVSISAADGSFEVEFEPPGDRRFEARAQRSGYAAKVWSWDSIVPGTHLDLGEVRLLRGAEVAVRIVDPEDRPFRSGWRAEIAGRLDGASAVFHAHRGTDGLLIFDTVPAGEWELKATALAAGEELHSRFSLAQGERAELTLRAGTSSRIGQLRVDVVPTRRLPLERSIEHVRLVALDGRTIEPEASPAEVLRTTFLFTELQPGVYTLEVSDSRFEPWSSTVRVPEEDRIVARLVGSVTLRIMVRHEGREVEDYVAALVGVGGEVRRVHALDPDSSPSLAGVGVYRGILPGTWWLAVSAGHLGRAERALGQLLPGEDRVVTVDLVGSGSIEGRVEDEHGPLATGAEVHLKKEDASGASAPPVIASVNEAGGFRFEAVEAGVYTLWAEARGFESASRLVDSSSGGDVRDVVLDFTGCAHLRGRIDVPRDCDTGSFQVGLTSESGELASWMATASLAGEFELGPLRPGPYRLHLRPEPVSAGFEFLEGSVLEETVHLGSGTVEREFEAFPDGWGELMILVRIDGQAVDRAWLHALSGSTWVRKLVEIGEEGLLGPLPVGKCAVWVVPEDGRWCNAIPQELEIRRCNKTPIEIRCHIVRGNLRVLDQSGTPLAGEEFVVKPAGTGSGMTLRVRSDAAGVVQLELPTGCEFRVGRPADGSGNLADGSPRFEWNDSGPSPREVRLGSE